MKFLADCDDLCDLDVILLMEEMEDVDNFASDLSDVDMDVPESRQDPSAASIFSLFRYRSTNGRSSDANSSSDSDTHQEGENLAMDEHTRSLPCDHQVVSI